MKLILFSPQIPQNTGNIARTCSVTHTDLILVRPLGFSTSNRHMKRAGLDYWDHLAPLEIDDLPTYLASQSAPFAFFSSKATKPYSDLRYEPNHLLIFGSETSGLPPFYHEQWPHLFYTIPMRPHARSLNLATSAAVVLYEGLRQLNFFPTQPPEQTV